MHRSLMRDADGNPCGMRMLCVDVTETRKELEDARRRNAKLESVIESMCTAVLVTDAVGFIRSANPAAEELLGWQTSELRGVSIEEGFPVLAYLGGGRSELTFSMALEGPSKGLATVLDRQRREVHIELGTSPILDKETGTTIGVVLVLHKLEVP
jgi:PAS domain S-box-containing protein